MRKKDKATASSSSRSKNEQLRQAHLQNKTQLLKARKEQLKGQKLYLEDSQSHAGKVVSMLDGVLSFGRTQPISFQVCANEKIHLTGNNGSGKSTLLKTLFGEVALQQGELRLNTPLYYLDQHFGTVQPKLSILDNLMQQCGGL